MPGAPPRKSTARPESSASAGRPDSRAALRALRMAFSINDRPVSSGSTMENSPTERTRTLLPSMACSSLSLPALWLASTSSLKCIMDSGPSFVWEDFLVEIEAVRHAIGSMHIDGETQHLALGEVELRQVIDGLTFGDLLEGQRLAAADQIFHFTTDAGAAGLARLEHGDIHHALRLAAHQAAGRGDIRLQKAGVEGDVVHIEIAEGLLAFSQRRQAQAQGDKQ